MKENVSALKIAFLGFVVSLAVGCVVGQKVTLAYTPEGIETKVVSTNRITVVVNDKRPYVKTGEKEPWYIGHYRAGFGNTWDVSTDGKVALADQFRMDLQKELESLGFTLDQPFNRTLNVDIIDYNFDAMLNGKMWYAIRIKVLDDQNRILAEDMLEDRIIIEGSFWVGAKYAFEKEVPKIYGNIIKQIVRENTDVVNALR